ncbi:MAG: hypothetical protein U0768_10315 [Anaerolineae bacterium]
MSLGLTGENQILLLLICIVSIVVVPLVFWGLSLITWLVRRLFRVDLGGVWVFGLCIGIPLAILAGSLAIDALGQTRPAQVIQKSEPVRLHTADGTWSQGLSLVVRYDTAGAPLPRFTEYIMAVMDAQHPGSTQEIATLNPPAADFDRLHAGDSYDVRFFRLAQFASLVRPADQSTWTVFPWLWIEGALMVVGLVFIAYFLRKTPLGYWPLAILILFALTLPPLQGFYLWRQRDDLGAATQRATAEVKDVTRIYRVFFGRGSSGSTYDLSQPFDIVQLSFTPPNFRDPVTIVDAIDADGKSPPEFGKGALVDIVYAPDDPRDGRIVGETRTHHLRTPLQIYSDNALMLLLGGLLLVGMSLGGRWLGKAIKSRRPAPPP